MDGGKFSENSARKIYVMKICTYIELGALYFYIFICLRAPLPFPREGVLYSRKTREWLPGLFLKICAKMCAFFFFFLLWFCLVCVSGGVWVCFLYKTSVIYHSELPLCSWLAWWSPVLATWLVPWVKVRGRLRSERSWMCFRLWGLYRQRGMFVFICVRVCVVLCVLCECCVCCVRVGVLLVKGCRRRACCPPSRVKRPLLIYYHMQYNTTGRRRRRGLRTILPVLGWGGGGGAWSS